MHSKSELISLGGQISRDGEGALSRESKSNPLISIITVNLNDGKFLEETILSVTSQTYKNIEYIIIDGGSKDQSLDIITKYRKKTLIYH